MCSSDLRGHGEQTQFYRSDAPTQTIPPYTADAGEADRALAERCRQLAEVAAFPHDFTVAMNPQRRPEDRYYVAIHGLGTTYDGYGSTLGEAAGRAIRATAPGLTLAPTDRR